MSLWQWTGTRFDTLSLRQTMLRADAYLYCPGPSLKAVDNSKIHVPGAVAFAVTTAYPHVRPDIWCGLDQTECYDRRLWMEPFVKIMRGNYRNMCCDGLPVRECPNVYFADLVAPPQETPYKLILERSDQFTWHRNVFIYALHIMLYMGARKIHFVGCDMGGTTDYYDDRKLSGDGRAANQQLYAQETASLRTLMPELQKQGVELISCTPGSPLNAFMPFVPLEDALAKTAASIPASGPVLTAAEATAAAEKVAVITPTRGDRPQFVAQCKRMIARQTVQPTAVYLIDYPPVGEGKDQRERVLCGVEKALEAGIPRILIMEDDDYYRDDYIETMLAVWPLDIPLIGSRLYSLYHLGERCRLPLTTEQCSSGHGVLGSPLAHTGFHTGLLKRVMCWSRYGQRPNLDDDIWAWAQTENIPRKLVEIPNLMISIEHNMGLCAEGCHPTMIKRPGAIPDPELKWLKMHVQPEFHAFYAQGWRSAAQTVMPTPTPTPTTPTKTVIL